MTPEGWGTNLGAIAAASVAAWQAWKARRAAGGAATTEQLTKVGDRATAAAEEAAQAVRDAPTANGYVPKSIGLLKEIKDGQAAIRDEVAIIRQRLDRHVDDHASADVGRG